MIESIRSLGVRDPGAGQEDNGFTLIEILIVIVVLGVLAAIVVFALGGFTTQSARSACRTDAKTVDVAVSAFRTQHPDTSQVTESGLSTGSEAMLQSWPASTSYVISIAGDSYPVLVAGNPNLTSDSPAVAPRANDVIVRITDGGPNNGKYYDATVNPSTACSSE